MASSNKSLADKINEIRAEQAKRSLIDNLYAPALKQPPPDQEEMDKLASALTEAVLQLRAGDMEGARKTLGDANELCGVQIRGTFPAPIDHYADALRYGSSTVKHIYQPSDSGNSATEIILKQQIAERQMRQAMDSINTTLYPPVILSDNTVDPTDPGS